MNKLNTIPCFLLVLWLSVASALFAQQSPPALSVNELFQQANALYSEGQFEAAIQAYEAVLDRGAHSAAIHFNLGSAHAQIENYGEAILHFKKARLLDPANGEILANLNHTYDLARLRQPDRSTLLVFSDLMHPDIWATLAILAFWSLMGFLCIPPLLKRSRPPAWISASACAVLFAICVTALVPKWSIDQTAVVISRNAALKIAPTESSPLLIELPTAETVLIKRSERGHFFVENERSQPGWIAADQIKPLIP